MSKSLNYDECLQNPNENAEKILALISSSDEPFSFDLKVTDRDIFIAKLVDKFCKFKITDSGLKERLGKYVESIIFNPKFNQKLKALSKTRGLYNFYSLRQANFSTSYSEHFYELSGKLKLQELPKGGYTFTPESKKPSLFDIYVLNGMLSLYSIINKIPTISPRVEELRLLTKNAEKIIKTIEQKVKEEGSELLPGDIMANVFARADLFSGNTPSFFKRVTLGQYNMQAKSLAADYGHIGINIGDGRQVHSVIGGARVDNLNWHDFVVAEKYRLNIEKLLPPNTAPEIKTQVEEIFNKSAKTVSEMINSEKDLHKIDNTALHGIKAALTPIIGGWQSLFGRGKSAHGSLEDMIKKANSSGKNPEVICSEFGALFLRDIINKTNEELRTMRLQEMTNPFDGLDLAKVMPQGLIDYLKRNDWIKPVALGVIDCHDLKKQIQQREKIKKDYAKRAFLFKRALKRGSKNLNQELKQRILSLKHAETVDEFIKTFKALLSEQLWLKESSGSDLAIAKFAIEEAIDKEVLALKPALEKVWSKTQDPEKRFQDSSHLIVRVIKNVMKLLGISVPIKDRLEKLAGAVNSLTEQVEQKAVSKAISNPHKGGVRPNPQIF